MIDIERRSDEPAERLDDVWVIVPCFDEEAVVADVLADLSVSFPNIVCVDDGSRDGTAQKIEEHRAHRVSHPVNLGQGAAIQTGVEFARHRPGARYFVTFDADGQHRTGDAVAMVERLRVEPFDIVIGTRFGHGAVNSVPTIKRVILRTAVHLSPTIRKLGLSDAHNGLRAFNRTVAEALDLTMTRMDHAGEFIELIAANGWRVVEQPVEILYTQYSRTKGQSMYNAINIVADGLLRSRGRTR